MHASFGIGSSEKNARTTHAGVYYVSTYQQDIGHLGHLGHQNFQGHLRQFLKQAFMVFFRGNQILSGRLVGEHKPGGIRLSNGLQPN